MKIHFAAKLHDSLEIKTDCGIVGFDEGCYEFTVTGSENRLDFTDDRKQTTCLRCVAARKAQLKA